MYNPRLGEIVKDLMRDPQVRAKRGRSRVTNSETQPLSRKFGAKRALFATKIVKSNAWTRRLSDLIELFATDLGGIDTITTAQRSLVRRVATLTVELELLELRFAVAGQASSEDLDLYARVSGGLRRLLETIGLQRATKDVTPSIDDIVEEELEQERQREAEEREAKQTEQQERQVEREAIQRNAVAIDGETAA